MNDLSLRIKALRSEIDKLSVRIAHAVKDANFDQGTLKELRSTKARLELELPKLLKQQWEETHERLDLGDD
jgi:hypothetical protein